MVRLTARGDPGGMAFTFTHEFNKESQALNRYKNEFGSPGKIFQVPVLAPRLDSTSPSADAFGPKTDDAVRLTGDST